MKIYISADIEGVAGVVTPMQGTPGNAEYEYARRLMTEEVNAAIEGALAGGASRVLVNDSHGPMTNLLAESLHPAAELIQGNIKPMGMFAGLEPGFAGAMCLGYHAAARRFGVMAHTFNGFAFGRVRVNGRELGEPGLYGAYAGSLGIPVIALSGDDRLAEEARILFPSAEMAVVKHALGTRAARSVHPKEARVRIRAAAERAVRRASACEPFVIEGPYRLEVEMNSPVLGDLAAGIPVAERLDAVTVALSAPTMAAVVDWVRTISTLSLAVR